MRFFAIALAATAMSVPAMANHVTSPNGTVLNNTPEMHAGFANRGQCQAAFRQLRNDQRRSGERGGEPYNSMDNGEYNNASRTTTRCEEIGGRYYVVFNANGF
ncbi:MAG TPA: hypothetical protein VEW25_07895 [Allosphingosinicella sp.]|nr:hypothetical protein [Allosphingosinicella sp.]